MIIRNVKINENFKINDKIVATMGNFDGLHKAHLSLINKVIKISKNKGYKSAVITFYPYLNNKNSQLNTLKEKEDILRNLNVDYLINIDFNKTLMQLSGDEYIKLIQSNLDIEELVVGFDFKYGENATFNVGDLKQYNFTLHVQEAILNEESSKIGSTLIRNLLKEGNVTLVKQNLSRDYSLTGEVVHGRKIGASIDFRTANMEYNKEKTLPKRGVYHTITKIGEDTFDSITNIGVNPTVSDEEKIKIETHIIDFDKVIYGEIIKISFVEKIRDEQKFCSLSELKEQIERDKRFVVDKRKK